MLKQRRYAYFLLLFFLLFFFFPSQGKDGSQEYFLAAGTALYKETAQFSKAPAFLVNQDMLVRVLGSRESVFTIGATQKRFTALLVEIPGSGNFYCMDGIDVVRNPKTGKFQFSFTPLFSLMAAGCACILAALLLLIGFFKKSKCCETEDRITHIQNCLSLTLIQWGFMLYIIGRTANIMMIPIDDVFYYNIAVDLSKLDFSGKWNYTIGLPIFYLPFALFSGRAAFPDIHICLNCFNAFLVSPVLLCMAYFVIRKLLSSRKAMVVLLIYFAMILFYHHRYFYSGSDTVLDSYVMKSFPAFPILSFTYSLHELYVLLGYNAFSDTLSCALIFSCLACVLYMKENLRNLALFSALYGLACLVRLNNILFAFLFLFILWIRYNPLEKGGVRYLFRFLLTGAISFCIVAGVQLIVNKVQLGGFFTTPYSLHHYPGIESGFLWSMLPFGIRFLSINNHAYFVVGALSLLFIPDRRKRIILSLWCLPLIFFFFGYPVVFSNGTRFILPVYCGLIAAFFLTDFPYTALSSRIRILAVLLMGIGLTAPAGSERLTAFQPWNWNRIGIGAELTQWIQYIVILISIGIITSFVFDWRKAADAEEKRKVQTLILFLASFILLFYWANPYVTASVMFLALLRTFYDIVMILRTKESCGSLQH